MTTAAPKKSPSAPALPAEVVVLGEVLVDLFAVTGDGALTSPEEAPLFLKFLGGAAANLAVGLRRQGIPTGLVSMVGGDAFGRFARAELAREGVALDGTLVHAKARTGVVFLSASATARATDASAGRLFVQAYRSEAADRLLAPSDVSPASVTRGRVLVVGSAPVSREPARSAVARAIELARGAGRVVFCDLNYRPHQFDDTREATTLLRRLLTQVDVVKLAKEELLPLFGTEDLEAAAHAARKLGPKIVVITQGAGGSLLVAPTGQVFLAAEPSKIVDPTGAGDAYSAGFLAALLPALAAKDKSPVDLATMPMTVLKKAGLRGGTLAAKALSAVGATAGLRNLPPLVLL